MKKTLQVIMLIVILCIFNTAFSYEINAVRIAPWYALNDIAYNAGTYVAVGDKGTILVSSDLTNWQKIDPITKENISIIETNGEEFVAITKNYILKSKDGYNWNSIPNIGFYGGDLFRWTGEYYIAYMCKELGEQGFCITKDFIEYENYPINIKTNSGLRVNLGGPDDLFILDDKYIAIYLNTENGVFSSYFSTDRKEWKPLQNLNNVVFCTMMENKLLIYILDNKELKVLYTSDLENWHIEDIVLNNSFEFLSRKNLAFIKGKNNIDILYLSNDFKRDESGKFANDYLFASSNDGFKFVDTGQRCEYIGLSQFKFYNVNGNPIGMSREKFIKPSDDIYWKSILREYNDIRLQNDQEKYGDIIFDGNVFFKWYARKLYQSENANEWDEIHMSDNAKKLFEARAGNYQIIKADDIYMFRYKAADLNRDRIPNIDQYDKVYIFDKNMELISEHSFGKFVSNISYCDNVYFAETDKNYYSLDGLTWNEYDKTSRIPITNGHSVASFGERIEVSRTVFNGNFDTVVYETIKPDNPKNYADLFAYTLYDADNSQMSVFVSKDAIYWEEIKLPEETAQVQEMYHKDGKLVVEFREWLYEISYDEIHRNMSSQTSYVMVNNHILGFDTRPVIENDRTLVPMRFLFEALGADVDWDAVTRSAIVQSGDTVIRFSIDDTSVQINDKIKTMDVPARLIDSKTLVPLRFLSEELGYTVEWDESTRTATVSK